MIDAGAAPTGPPEWMEKARSVLADGAGLGLSHLDASDNRGCRAPASLLDASGPDLLVAATWAGGLDDVSPAQQALPDRFAAEAVDITQLCSRPDEILPLLARMVASVPVQAERAPPCLSPSAAELLRRHP